MNPRQIDDMSWAMAEVYASVTDRILVNLAKYFPYIKDGKEPKNLFDYQARMLAQVASLNIASLAEMPLLMPIAP